ncbi:hypothetical protein [Oecophyllibacter saccharovorans]|uniref:HU family DNA-binding protein n=1 Tax=Oecophyllibacter saccharovorans TaxID=2558360 RepID=A0A506UMH2_9PROT|nr:hypothetical protein [Oecophyllibacter saccharovorans]QDH15548.1 hypothetical protein E3E11_06465 [Oecophyllibacter saccharovorans]TPW34383.1 hypothetical protein E3202_07815 [Oecophyllibacter saccharovorans]TPW36566.1 hypothetical protein E3203_02045 [Oecophyllibacter saccharovorans]
MATTIDQILLKAVQGAGGQLSAQQATEAHRLYAEFFLQALAAEGELHDLYIGKFHVSPVKASKQVCHFKGADFGKVLDIPAYKRIDFDASIDAKEVINGKKAEFGLHGSKA